MLPLRYHDDADKPVRLHFAGLIAAARSLLPRRGEHDAFFVRLIVGLFRGETLVVVGTLLLLGVITAMTIKEVSTGMWLLLFSPIASSLVVTIAGGLVTLGVLTTRMRARIVRVQLGRNRCAGCNYSLAGLAPEAGAKLLVCPECGGAWRQERLGVAHDAPAEVIVIRTSSPAAATATPAATTPATTTPPGA